MVSALASQQDGCTFESPGVQWPPSLSPKTCIWGCQDQDQVQGQDPAPGLAAGQSPFFSSLFRSAGRPAQSTSDRSRRGAITQRGENQTFVAGKQRFIKKRLK